MTDRIPCEECGETHVEIRVYPFGGWIPDALVCRECFAGFDTENSFTDFRLIQKAIENA